MPDNYYDYVAGRFGVDADTVAELRELDLLYDRTPTARSSTSTPEPSARCSSNSSSGLGRYDGYGTDNAPVRLAAQRLVASEPGQRCHSQIAQRSRVVAPTGTTHAVSGTEWVHGSRAEESQAEPHQ